VHLGGSVADFMAKYGQKVVEFIGLSIKIQEKYFLW
jgi:hypothetical protein